MLVHLKKKMKMSTPMKHFQIMTSKSKTRKHQIQTFTVGLGHPRLPLKVFVDLSHLLVVTEDVQPIDELLSLEALYTGWRIYY